MNVSYWTADGGKALQRPSRQITFWDLRDELHDLSARGSVIWMFLGVLVARLTSTELDLISIVLD